jgi:hypothetical protein
MADRNNQTDEAREPHEHNVAAGDIASRTRAAQPDEKEWSLGFWQVTFTSH